MNTVSAKKAMQYSLFYDIKQFISYTMTLNYMMTPIYHSVTSSSGYRKPPTTP